MNKLLLGAGEWHWADWVTIEANPKMTPTIVADIPPLPPRVLSEKWDVILGVHVIEHIYPWVVPELLFECFSILAPGGTLILEQPNLDFVTEVMAGHIELPPGSNYDQFTMWPLYGDPTHRDPYMMHRWGYTPATLTSLLVANGFSHDKIKLKPAEYHIPLRDFRLEAMR